MTAGTKASCTCAECVACCEFKPGWFLPEEIAPLAAAMGLTEKELFDRHLMVDAWYGDTVAEDIYLLAPGIVGGDIGDHYPTKPTGVCVFLKGGLCSIHEQGKPFECRATIHGPIPSPHEEVGRAWDKPEHQAKVAQLLGRKPERAEIDILTAIDMMFGVR